MLSGYIDSSNVCVHVCIYSVSLKLVTKAHTILLLEPCICILKLMYFF